jgi:hypothetical protein
MAHHRWNESHVSYLIAPYHSNSPLTLLNCNSPRHETPALWRTTRCDGVPGYTELKSNSNHGYSSHGWATDNLLCPAKHC